MKQLLSITIPNFTNTIVISNKQQVKAYYKHKKTPKLPLKYQDLENGGLKGLYSWDSKGRLIDIGNNNEIVPSNKSKAGTPRLWICNMQDIYSAKLNPFARASYILKMKEYLLPYFQDREFINQKDLGLVLQFHLAEKKNWINNLDIDNISSIWFKAVLDALKGTIIKEDNPFIVNKIKSSVTFVDESEQKLIIELWK